MSAEILFENFELLAEGMNGVKHLRALILQLAFQGKLVSQDPSDEPANRLSPKIEAEKIALIEKWKLRIPNITELTDVKKMLVEIPPNWQWYRLGDVVFFQEGPGIRNWQFKSTGVKLLNVQNILSNGSLNFEKSDKYVSELEFNEKYSHFLIVEGDLLFASSGGSWGKSAWYKSPGYKVMLNTSTVRLRFYSRRFEPNYLKYFLDTEHFKRQMEIQLVGIQPNFGSTHLSRTYIPIPPLPEQCRIITKVDQLMKLCDELEEKQKKRNETRISLNTSALDHLLAAKEPKEFDTHWQRISTNFDLLYDKQETVGKLRKAILQLAVQGKLVPQDPKDEPATVLLEILNKEKERLRNQGELRQTSPIAPITITSEEFEGELPEGWMLCRFGELIDCYRGHNPPKHQFITQPRKGYVRFIQITDFKTDKSAVYVPESKNLKMVDKGEILMAAYRHIGKLSRKVAGAFNVACCKIMEFQPLDRDFVELLIGTKYVKGALLEASGRAHIPSMHTDHLLSLIVPLPPLSEQRRIVLRFRELMLLCDELETKLTHAEQASEELVEAVVREVVKT